MQLYEIGKLIGTGSSGDVFLCRNIKQKGYNYALKKIKMIQIEEKERQNIENELKLLQKLRHTNIISYKDSFTDKDGCLCIVMVYCQMGDMHTKIKQTKEKGKNFTEAQILDWLTQTSLAIYYLHNQKILHRDLKTQNLFLKKDERIRLGDFGISKVLDTTQDLAITCIGTPYYMAPEVFKYKPYSYKSDIWSLGIIIYEMCNLRLPFQAQHYNGLAMKILKGSYPSITPTYSKQLRDLIKSMLCKKPQDRPTIVDILNKPFIRTRTQRYMNDLFTRTIVATDFDDIYLDTLREQAHLLQITCGVQEEAIKKYPSSKDIQKKQVYTRSFINKRTQEQDYDLLKQYHSKRKSTFQRHFHSNDKYPTKKSDQTSSSFKALNLGNYGLRDEKQAFIDHKKTTMMERDQKRNEDKRNSFDSKKFQQEYKDTSKRFKIFEEYTMQEQNQYTEIEPIEQQIINQQQDEDLQSSINLQNLQEDEQVPQSYNKSYYKLLDQIKVLKHRCENALGGNKYLRVYNAVNNGANKHGILQILGAQMIGYWHLIDQIMFNQSILKTLPKN